LVRRSCGDRSWKGIVKLRQIWRRAGIFICASVVALLVTISSLVAKQREHEVVWNPSAAVNLSHWRFGTETGVMTLSRAEISDGPEGVKTAIEVRRSGPESKWVYVLANLRAPESSLKVGRTYQIRGYVRDLNASGSSAGILLGNSNFDHRPTEASQYRGYSDDSWHLLQRTFVATRAAADDTALYFDFPAQGALHWLITLASVREVKLPKPPRTLNGPSQVLEFNGPAGASPDPRYWTHELGGHGWGNGEVQTYTNDTSNAFVNGEGDLVIAARREDRTGFDGIARRYTSARLVTKGKYAVPPGSYVEASIRVPVGYGIRPAFWLMGANHTDVGWPLCGELDVMESSQRSPSTIRQNIHLARISDSTEDAPYGESAPGGFTELSSARNVRSHRYGVYFDNHVVQFYVNGEPTLKLTHQEAAERDRIWPFAQPQTIIINTAVVGNPDDSALPAVMEVSKISVWEDGVPLL